MTMETLLLDVKNALRQFRKRPAFTAVAIMVLGLGLGANTAIFSVVNAVLLHAVPYVDSDRLVVLYEHDIDPGSGRSSISYADFQDWRSQSRTTVNLAIARDEQFNLADDRSRSPERLEGAIASGNLFAALGNVPLLGRAIAPADDRPGAPLVVVIGYGLWQRRFGGTADIVGRRLRLDGTDYTIVGVMPKAFHYPRAGSEAWIAAAPALSDNARTKRGWRQFHGVARLAPGASVDQARRELTGIALRIKQSNPGMPLASGVEVFPIVEFATHNVRTALLVLFSAVGCVLLISCVNIANLLLARASQRKKEMAIRAAIGASRVRIAAQLLTESSLLAFGGAAVGLLLASFTVEALARGASSLVNRGAIQPVGDIRLDAGVFLFTFFAAGIVGIAVGIMPALRMSRADLTGDLKDNSRSVTAGPGHARVRNTLVATEVALSLALLICAGLLLRSFVAIRAVRPGVRTDHVLTAGVSLPPGAYPRGSDITAFADRLHEKLMALPGVTAAAISSCLPIDGFCGDQFFLIDGHPLPPGKMLDANTWAVSTDFFRATGIPVTRGRSFSDQDIERARAKPARYTAVITEAMAKKFWRGEDPIGQAIRFGDAADDPRWEIIGVCGDVVAGLDEKAEPAYFVPLTEWRTFYAVIATTVAPESLAAAVRQTISTLDPDVPAFRIRTMKEVSDASSSNRSFSTLLIAVFAALALLLSAIGLYGVLSYLVTQRTGEIGIRMVLGATSREVQRLVIRQGMLPVAAGLAVGVAVALAASRWLTSLLFGAASGDAIIFAGASFLVAAVSWLACLVPAARAGSVDPAVALRDS
jgi:putative ABC transport system permease protein